MEVRCSFVFKEKLGFSHRPAIIGNYFSGLNHFPNLDVGKNKCGSSPIVSGKENTPMEEEKLKLPCWIGPGRMFFPAILSL